MTGATAVPTEAELERDSTTLNSQIFNLEAQRELALARSEDTSALLTEIEALEKQRDDIQATIRGARRIRAEGSKQSAATARKKAFESARYALADIATLAGEIDMAETTQAERVSRLRAAESAVRRTARAIGGGELCDMLPSFLSEPELKLLLEYVPRGQVRRESLISDRVSARAGKAFTLIQAALAESET